MLNQKRLTKKELIVAAWERLGCDSIGASEIAAIQCEVGMESPASIARVLADEGLRMRHPEVIEADQRWRESHFHSLFRPEELDFDSLIEAVNSLKKITELAEVLKTDEDTVGSKQLESLVIGLRKELQESASSSVVAILTRSLAGEVSEWLLIWLQSPTLFQDWFDLRVKSADFVGKFGTLPDV